jgi:hypothetical protein
LLEDDKMATEEPLFEAMRIRDAIGQIADGIETSPLLLACTRAAVSGFCLTADRGEQEFAVDVSGCRLTNVDTEELIWPRTVGHIGESNDVPLRVLTSPELWSRACVIWEKKDPLAWTAFMWRIAIPLSNRLNLAGAWR